MKDVKWFSQGFIAMIAIYAIPLWVARTYFNASDSTLCYTLIGTQMVVTFGAAIAQIIRNGSVVKWIVSAISAVALNAAFLYVMVLMTDVQIAIAAYVVLGAASVGKSTMEHFLFVNAMKRIYPLSSETSAGA